MKTGTVYSTDTPEPMQGACHACGPGPALSGRAGNPEPWECIRYHPPGLVADLAGTGGDYWPPTTGLLGRKVSSAGLVLTTESAGTLLVTKILPPTVTPLPMTVSPPRMVALA